MEFTPKVVVVMPRYGDVSLGAAAGFITPTLGAVEVVQNVEMSSSATPHSFNGLLAIALDMRDRGEVTHIAMIHSDVSPHATEGGRWLDILWREMKAHKADLISAVIPIKEPDRQRTSTAIGAEDDIWCPTGFIANGHRESLPTTFGPDDVCKPGEVLLVNTGLFLADLRRPWWDGFAFEFRNRIIYRDGRRVSQFAPEDWLLSRHIQASGGIVRATWAVQVDHRGQAEWANY